VIALPQHKLDRLPLNIVFHEPTRFTETYGGGHGVVVLEGQHLKPRDVSSKTVVVFMHPTGTMNLLPLPNALAHAGMPVITCASRYPHNDTALIMEKVVVDLGKVVEHARNKLGYEHVILGGWSGGGSLSLFYQSQAEHADITHTPAGDEVDLTRATLPSADGVMQLAAHVSRASTLTEWMDASLEHEHDPFDTEVSLDLYHPEGPKPPYDAAFLARYREAQRARNRRITAWVKHELEALKRRDGGSLERGFVTHGTMADPRWLDPTVDPNDRVPGRCYLGDPRVVNHGPVGLARFSTLRSWLSQWSIDDSNADGPRHAARISVPSLVVENTADDACTPSHTQRIYAALLGDKQLVRIAGATHYYLAEPDKLRAATIACLEWLAKHGWHDLGSAGGG